MILYSYISGPDCIMAFDTDCVSPFSLVNTTLTCTVNGETVTKDGEWFLSFVEAKYHRLGELNELENGLVSAIKKASNKRKTRLLDQQEPKPGQWSGFDE